MNIRRFIFKALFVSIFTAILMAIYIITKHAGLTYNVSVFITILIVILFHDHMQNWLANATDKYLFQKDYDYWAVLKQIKTDLDNITYLDDLKKYIPSALIDKLRLEDAIILEKNDFENEKALKKRLKMAYSQPIPLDGQMYWLLLLGKKKSGTRYSKQDRTLFSTLSTSFSMRIGLIMLTQTVAIGKQIDEILKDSNQ